MRESTGGRLVRFISLLLSICLLAFLALPALTPEVSAEDNVRPDHEELMSALIEAEIEQLLQAMDLGMLTSVECTQFYLERIEAYNKEFNCFITICDDALEQAALRDQQRAAGETGALLGIPVVVKDNIKVKGYPTTNGKKSELGKKSTENAQVVEYLLAEGAVIIGKTNMSTSAMDARRSYSSAAGETKNAYNSLLVSGGSSGGSASGVSLNFAAAGLGTDTNSSLRLPAVLNGCYALRCTEYSLSTKGILPLNTRRDIPGAITRNVHDLALMLDVLSGGTTSYRENLDSNVLSGLRIGVVKEYSNPKRSNADKEVSAAFEQALEELKACGAEVVEISLKSVTSYDLNADKSAVVRPALQNFNSALKSANVSVVVFPSYQNTPIRSGTDANGKKWTATAQPFLNNTRSISSFLGVPEISVPIGYHSLGAGIGMEICGPKDSEQLLLNIAYSYELHCGHREAPADAPDLHADGAGRSLDILLAQWRRAVQPQGTKRSKLPDRMPIRLPQELLTVPELILEKLP